nr:DUF3025 domain-containing protein [Comamonas terrigena]
MGAAAADRCAACPRLAAPDGGAAPVVVHSRLLPVGHALLEKLAAPRKPITAHLLCLPTDGTQALPGCADMPALCDAALARQPLLQAAALAPSHLPRCRCWGCRVVAGKYELSFYDDSLVFRASVPAIPR